MLTTKRSTSTVLLLSVLHDEEFYIGKVEDPMSPRSEEQLSFSSTGELLKRKTRNLRDNSRLLDKYLSGEGLLGNPAMHQCLVKNCPLNHSPTWKSH